MRNTSIRLTRVVMGVGVLTTGSLLVPATASAGALATCDGVPATIVGTPNQETLSGTTGPDVIVSNGAKSVYAAEGEDLVCVTGRASTYVLLDGYDEYHDNHAFANDRLIGSDGDDTISSGTYADVSVFDADIDNGDDISLGSGESTLTVFGVPSGSIDGGTGRDRMYMESAAPTFTINAGQSFAATGGTTEHGVADLSGIESFHLGRSQVSTVNFTGTSAAESLYFLDVEADEYETPTVNADFKGGADTLQVLPTTDGTVTGGSGDDQFRYVIYNVGQNLKMKMNKGKITGTKLEASTASFERLYVATNYVQITGDGLGNVIDAVACGIRVDGGAGNDHIRMQTLSTCDSNNHIANGGSGKDRLIGTRGRDDLIGGPGTDYANGGARSDRCVAETRLRCER